MLTTWCLTQRSWYSIKSKAVSNQTPLLHSSPCKRVQTAQRPKWLPLLHEQLYQQLIRHLSRLPGPFKSLCLHMASVFLIIVIIIITVVIIIMLAYLLSCSHQSMPAGPLPQDLARSWSGSYQRNVHRSCRGSAARREAGFRYGCHRQHWHQGGTAGSMSQERHSCTELSWGRWGFSIPKHLF